MFLSCRVVLQVHRFYMQYVLLLKTVSIIFIRLLSAIQVVLFPGLPAQTCVMITVKWYHLMITQNTQYTEVT